jgi:hypothetical protein
MNSYSEHTLTQNFRKIHLKFASMFWSLSFKFSNQNIKKSDVQYNCLYCTGSELGPAADSCSEEYKKLYGYRSTRNSNIILNIISLSIMLNKCHYCLNKIRSPEGRLLSERGCLSACSKKAPCIITTLLFLSLSHYVHIMALFKCA